MCDERKLKRRKKSCPLDDKIVRFLTANMKKIDEDGNSLLHLLVTFTTEEYIEHLIKVGSDVDLKNYAGDPPLASAVRHNHFEGTKILLQYGARHDNSYFTDSVGPLHIAARNGCLDIVKLLIENGADIHACDRGKETPLHAVNRFYKPHFVFNWRVDVTISDRFNIAQALINAGADVNAKDEDNKTPLICAIESDFREGVTVLLIHAAMLHAQGARPLEFDPEALTEDEREFYASCLEELDSMKAIKFVNSNASFFTVLVKKDISGYARNKSIVRAIEKGDLSRSFSLYGIMLIDRFSKEVMTQRLLKKASRGLSRVFQWNENSMRVIIDCILPYLRKKDLKKLANI